MTEFIIVAESSADVAVATTLVERLLIQNIDWLDDENLQHLLVWSGLDSTGCSFWKDLNQIQQQFERNGFRIPRYLGHGKSGKKRADGAAAMKVLNLVRLLQKDRQIDAVFLIRDLDDQSERKEGLRQARLENIDREPKLAIVIGAANPKREAWVLNGFVPIDDNEAKILQKLKQRLSFDPCEEAERLREKSSDGPVRIRNSKFVLNLLTQGNLEREQQCWQETNLELLKKRGSETGIVDFFDEVLEMIVPLFTTFC
ncbi:MAG: hypothetical protein AAGD09_02850 [Cyanobacteria bacterium P01_F01_bin.56]